jgi:hypothetical protein
MLVRSRKLHLTASPLISGPLLVPGISSKGFPRTDTGLTEAGAALEFVSPDITEALLISAYDLHHKLLPDGERLLGPEHHGTIYATPRLLIVDSGGYELNPVGFESGETQRGLYRPETFTRENFEALVDRLPHDRELLVVSYDSPERPRASYKEQRETAQRFFAGRNHLRSDFLLKPQANDRVLDVAQLTPNAADLSCFDVIGATEKELGETLVERLIRLARLRKLLDVSGCADKPIHVFGSLDPLLTPLYFMAGAEIFDGLSWLRYAYVDGLSIHPDQLSVIRRRLGDREARRDFFRHASNLQEIKSLKDNLRRWANEPDRYEHLSPARHVILREIYETMLAELAQEG